MKILPTSLIMGVYPSSTNYVFTIIITLSVLMMMVMMIMMKWWWWWRFLWIFFFPCSSPCHFFSMSVSRAIRLINRYMSISFRTAKWWSHLFRNMFWSICSSIFGRRNLRRTLVPTLCVAAASRCERSQRVIRRDSKTKHWSITARVSLHVVVILY